MRDFIKLFFIATLTINAFSKVIGDNELKLGDKGDTDPVIIKTKDGGFIKKTNSGAWSYSDDGLTETPFGQSSSLVFYGPYTLTVTGTNWTTSSARARIEYVNGTYYITFNIKGSVSSAVSSLNLTVNALEFSADQQSCSAVTTDGAGKSIDRCTTGESNNILYLTASSNTTFWLVHGTVELSGKPGLVP